MTGTFDLEGRTAFVTGAGSGIGRALARALWGEGMCVVLADRAEDGLRAALADYTAGDRVMTLALDVTDRAAYAAARDAALARFGRIDLLAGIAGVGGGAAIDLADFNDWDWVLGVNLGGLVNGIVTMLPTLRARADGAAIVTMGSILSTFPQPGPAGPYGVAKAAALALSDSLRWQLKGTGVGVTTVCPGYVDTGIALSEQRRPARYPVTSPRDPGHQAFFESLLKEAGMSPDEVAAKIVEGVRRRAPYVMTHPEFLGAARAYWDGVLAGYGDGETSDPGRAKAGAETAAFVKGLVAAP